MDIEEFAQFRKQLEQIQSEFIPHQNRYNQQLGDLQEILGRKSYVLYRIKCTPGSQYRVKHRTGYFTSREIAEKHLPKSEYAWKYSITSEEIPLTISILERLNQSPPRLPY